MGKYIQVTALQIITGAITQYTAEKEELYVSKFICRGLQLAQNEIIIKLQFA